MRVLLLAFAPVLLAACSEDEIEERSESVGTQIAEDYNDALKKAGDVEEQLLEQKRLMDEALEEAENASREP